MLTKQEYLSFRDEYDQLAWQASPKGDKFYENGFIRTVFRGGIWIDKTWPSKYKVYLDGQKTRKNLTFNELEQLSKNDPYKSLKTYVVLQKKTYEY